MKTVRHAGRFLLPLGMLALAACQTVHVFDAPIVGRALSDIGKLVFIACRFSIPIKNALVVTGLQAAIFIASRSLCDVFPLFNRWQALVLRTAILIGGIPRHIDHRFSEIRLSRHRDIFGVDPVF